MGVVQLRLPLILLVALLSASAVEDRDPEVRVTLVPSAGSVAAGATVQLAVHFVVEPGWHIYWVNPGQSGMPATTLRVAAPTGWSVGPVQQPLPTRFSGEGGLVSYGWAGSSALLVDVVAGAESGEIAVDARWLACRERCVVGEASRTVHVTVDPAPAQSVAGTDARFAGWRSLLPTDVLPAGAAWVCGESATLTVPVAAGVPVEFFPTVAFDEARGVARVERRADAATVALEVPASEALWKESGPWGVLRAGASGHTLTPPCATTPSPSSP